MQIGLKMLIAAIFSLLIGVAFASPLFYSDTVRPLREIPKGPTADVLIDIAYADFQVQPAHADTVLPSWFDKKETAYNLTYCIVLNVTNNYDEAAVIGFLSFGAGRNFTSGAEFFRNYGSGGFVKGAWVDGVWYNVTWVRGYPSSPQFDESGELLSTSSFSETSDFEPYLQEGVYIYQRTATVNSSTSFCMDMNGTWVDITGRTNLTSHEIGPRNLMLYPVVSETRFFRESESDDPLEIGYLAHTTTYWSR